MGSDQKPSTPAGKPVGLLLWSQKKNDWNCNNGSRTRAIKSYSPAMYQCQSWGLEIGEWDPPPPQGEWSSSPIGGGFRYHCLVCFWGQPQMSTFWDVPSGTGSSYWWIHRARLAIVYSTFSEARNLYMDLPCCRCRRRVKRNGKNPRGRNVIPCQTKTLHKK